MRLVKGARRAWRWWSMQAMAAAAAIPFAWGALPGEVRDAIPEGWLRWITAAVLIGGIVGRLISQSTDE